MILNACRFAGQLQRATRYVALRDEANVLDEEAATWQLLWHLAGDSDERFPGGWGGGEEAAAATLESGRTTVHQQVAAIIASDDAINRCVFLRPPCQWQLIRSVVIECLYTEGADLQRVVRSVVEISKQT